MLRIVFNFGTEVKYFVSIVFSNFLTSNDSKSVETNQIIYKNSLFDLKIFSMSQTLYNGQYRNILQQSYVILINTTKI